MELCIRKSITSWDYCKYDHFVVFFI